MTTSSDHHQPSSPNSGQNRASGEHWYELTATLSPQSKEEFGKWIDGELAYLENDLQRFVTPKSLQNQRRG